MRTLGWPHRSQFVRSQRHWRVRRAVEPRTPQIRKCRPSGFARAASSRREGSAQSHYLPKVKREADIGPSLNFRIGLHLFSWSRSDLSRSASHERATVGGGATAPTGEGPDTIAAARRWRLGGRLGPIALFIRRAAPLTMISSNILEQVMLKKPGHGRAIQA